MNELISFITTEFLIVAIACEIVCLAIKFIPKIPSWIIPLVSLLLGIVLMMALMGWTPLNAALGILAAGVSSIIYEAFKQFIDNVVKKGA